MDSITHEILIWKHIQTERVDDYKYLLIELLNLGYRILSVTIDSKRGVNSVFKLSCTNMPFQPETYYSKIYYITSKTRS